MYDTTIELFPNSKKMVVNNTEKNIDMAPILESGKSYLPIRVVAQALGKDVTYKKQGNAYMYEIHESLK